MPNIAVFTKSTNELNKLNLKDTLQVVPRKDYKPCYHRRKTATGTCKMERPDVGILHCMDATEWSDSLIRNIETNFKFCRVFSQKLEVLELPVTMAKRGFFLRIKAQIVIISPDLLIYMKKNPDVILSNLFDPARVLAFVCGVEDSNFQTMHRANLPTFETWKKIYVTDDAEGCVLDILSWIDGVLSVDDTAEASKQTKAGFKLHPNKVREDAAKVLVQTLEQVPEGQTVNVTVETDTESIPLKAVMCNPYTAKFVLPARFFGVSQIVHITVKRGMKSLGSQPLKCESKMGELDNLLRTILHPLSFICQTLGLSESQIDELDHRLTNIVKINIPKCGFSVLDISSYIDRQRADGELPTLLHFSSKMGLKELSAVLLDCPGGEAACRLRNINGHTPADLAEMEGHSCLAGLLESYSSMSETAEIYTYMQRMTEDVNNENYENLSTTFRRSIEHGFQFSGFPRLSTNDDACTEGAVGGAVLQSNSYTNTEFHEQQTLRAQPEASPKGSNMHLYGQSQQELIQLIEDFKEDKYNIEQVEVLFKSWQQKQHSHSFYEKQKELKRLREQYEQLQKSCQENTKKKSPLERFRTMLLRNGKKEETNRAPAKAKVVYKREKSTENEDTLANLRLKARPCSTWSCGSTSSSISDRSSTMSGTSDSGTLSDIGEEKHAHKRCIIEEPRQLQQPYPRPFVPAAFENRQYMSGPPGPKPSPPPVPSKKPTRTPVSPIPSPMSSSPRQVRPKAVSPKLGSPKIVQPSPSRSSKPTMFTQMSISDRKPMPPPRELPDITLMRCSEITPEDTTTAVPFPQSSNTRKMSLPSHTYSVSPPECGSPTDGYLPMDSHRPVPGRRPSLPNNQAPITNDADYYNEVSGEYIRMQSVVNAEFTANLDMSLAAMWNNRNARAYVNVPCVRGATPEEDNDRCDSVPDMMAPPPPTTESRPRPPPLPPRNPEKSSHEDPSAKRN